MLANSFAIHIDCDNLWIYEQELGLKIPFDYDYLYNTALPRILDLLDRHNIKASFFIIGKELERESCRNFCNIALANGHLLANHSQTHAINFGTMAKSEREAEIIACHQAIEQYTGFSCKGFRAPGYGMNEHDITTLEKLGYVYDSSSLPGVTTLLIKLTTFTKSKTALTRLIQAEQPDIVHGLEFQHSCYLALQSIKQIPNNKRPIFGITNWGSDIYHFRKFPAHLKIIKELLATADFYSCECARDIEIVKSLGFSGKIWPVIPGCGGLNMNTVTEIARNAHPPSHRQMIMVKGYQHFAGRALTTLAALEECVSEIRPYTINVFSASAKVKNAYQEFARANNLKIEFIKGITQREMLSRYSKSRCFIASGVSDGISTSVLEAMAVGCFPIQSKSACCQEWFEHEKTGFATEVENISSIVRAIKQALNNDSLVDSAAPVNQQTIALRCDDRLVQKILLSQYTALC